MLPGSTNEPGQYHGKGFSISATAYLSDVPLLNMAWVDSATLAARVPFALPTGIYALSVANPDARVSLANAFTVTAGLVGWASRGPYGGGQDETIALHQAAKRAN